MRNDINQSHLENTQLHVGLHYIWDLYVLVVFIIITKKQNPPKCTEMHQMHYLILYISYLKVHYNKSQITQFPLNFAKAIGRRAWCSG